MDTQLKAQLKQTINVKSIASVDKYGSPTLGTTRTLSARVVVQSTVNTKAENLEGYTWHDIVTEEPIYVTDYIWLPGDSVTDTTLARQPRKVVVAIDEKGAVDYYLTII